MTTEDKSSRILLTPTETSRALAVSPRKLWAMTFEDDPGLPHVRFGRLVRYVMSDLENWIESQRRGGKPDEHAPLN